jgi:hypothetical protein
MSGRVLIPFLFGVVVFFGEINDLSEVRDTSGLDATLSAAWPARTSANFKKC